MYSVILYCYELSWGGGNLIFFHHCSNAELKLRGKNEGCIPVRGVFISRFLLSLSADILAIIKEFILNVTSFFLYVNIFIISMEFGGVYLKG